MEQKGKQYWDLLRDLRVHFLTEHPVTADYWSNLERLSAYDETFAARIGWKWQAVMAEVKTLGWLPSDQLAVIDWGCGTGIATRTLLNNFPQQASGATVYLHDRSHKAKHFAADKIRTIDAFNGSVVTDKPTSTNQPLLLLASHVITELSEPALAELRADLAECSACLFVEPGTKDAATKLAKLRDELLTLGWHPIAPCTHGQTCYAAQTTKHWCHSFAEPPPEVHRSAFWRQFSEQLNIDLRALPYSYVLMTRDEGLAATLRTSNRARVLGRPRLHKTHAEALLCDPNELAAKTLNSRKHPAEFANLTKHSPWV